MPDAPAGPPPTTNAPPAAAGPAGPVGPSGTAAPPDRPAFRLAVFGAVLVLVLSAAFGIGRLVDVDVADGVASSTTGDTTGGAGTIDADSQGTDSQGADTHGTESHGADAQHDDAAAHGTSTSAAPGAPTAVTATGDGVGGLAVTSAGLTLAPVATAFTAGRSAPLRFRILDTRGGPVTTFAVVHDKAMHLVVARRDLSGYQHLHPTMAPDGTWSVGLTLPAAGSWRAYADFAAVVGGRETPVTLGVDLDVSGGYARQPLPAPSRTATVAGFTASYLGTPRVGSVQPLLLRVQRGGAAAALQPYLGAYGHLVVLREGDLGYVHVHPEPELVDGAVKFWLAAPGPGRYRMFFDFQVAGQVHTAAFTMTVS